MENMDLISAIRRVGDAHRGVYAAREELSAATDALVEMMQSAAGYPTRTDDGVCASDRDTYEVTIGGEVVFTGSRDGCQTWADNHIPSGGYGIGPIFSET